MTASSTRRTAGSRAAAASGGRQASAAISGRAASRPGEPAGPATSRSSPASWSTCGSGGSSAGGGSTWWRRAGSRRGRVPGSPCSATRSRRRVVRSPAASGGVGPVAVGASSVSSGPSRSISQLSCARVAARCSATSSTVPTMPGATRWLRAGSSSRRRRHACAAAAVGATTRTRRPSSARPRTRAARASSSVPVTTTASLPASSRASTARCGGTGASGASGGSAASGGVGGVAGTGRTAVVGAASTPAAGASEDSVPGTSLRSAIAVTVTHLPRAQRSRVVCDSDQCPPRFTPRWNRSGRRTLQVQDSIVSARIGVLMPTTTPTGSPPPRRPSPPSPAGPPRSPASCAPPSSGGRRCSTRRPTRPSSTPSTRCGRGAGRPATSSR